MTKFCRFDLRTTDAAAARAFYSRVLGHDRASVWPLHERALARGAKPHWLGRLGVEDVERTASAFVARGAEPFGPVGPTADGGRAAVLRDPGGAVVSVGTPPPADGETGVGVVFHVLNTNDAEYAAATHRDLFGWDVAAGTELAAGVPVRQFAWQAGGANVGAIADIGARPGVHPHWLFFFEVEALEPAVAAARTAGGVAFAPGVAPGGARLCVCDDPQGAAFGLWERRASS